MTDIVIPSWIVPDSEEIELIDDGTTRFEPQFGRGQSQRQSYSAPRFKISRKHTVRLGEEANVMGAIIELRGAQNTVRTTVKRVLRGNYGLAEIVTNGSFANGTTGWSVIGGSLHTVQDRISKLQVGPAQNGISGTGYGIGRTLAATQYGTYAGRAIFRKGRGNESYSVSLDTGLILSTGSTTGLRTAAGVVLSATPTFNIGGFTASGSVYEDHSNCLQTSVARCALADNAGNSLLYSDVFSNAAWTQVNVTVSTSATLKADLSGVAEQITETTANGIHRIQQGYTVTAGTTEHAFTVEIKAGLRLFAGLNLTDGVQNNRVVFSLSGAGSITDSSLGFGSDLRGFIQLIGNGWYRCSMVCKKSAIASLTASVFASTNGLIASITYVGSTASPALLLNRAGSTITSLPARVSQSTSSIVAATGQTGSTLFIKGLPASTSALCVAGDWVEIGGELKRLTASLDSDGLGLGYLQFQPELVRSPVDNDPVIFFEPFGRFLISNIRTRARVSDIELTYDLEQIYE